MLGHGPAQSEVMCMEQLSSDAMLVSHWVTEVS